MFPITLLSYSNIDVQNCLRPLTPSSPDIEPAPMYPMILELLYMNQQTLFNNTGHPMESLLIRLTPLHQIKKSRFCQNPCRSSLLKLPYTSSSQMPKDNPESAIKAPISALTHGRKRYARRLCYCNLCWILGLPASISTN
jgi:hypothetical protein